MRNTNILAEDYYIWLLDIIENDEYYTEDYSKLLNRLFNTEFYSIVNYDDNRIFDGLNLRNTFADEVGEHIYFVSEQLPAYCTVLEMMIALAYRMENDIMSDDRYGDRTSLWFWTMIRNLGLDSCDDLDYDDRYVSDVMDIFLNRKYGKDGKGGPFWVRNMGQIDMRGTEIWYQANYFLDEFMS